MADSLIWSEKYSPRKLSDLTFSHKNKQILLELSKNSTFPHLIFYGPPGAGKKTRMSCFLAAFYGDGVYKSSVQQKEVKVKSSNIQYIVTSSNYHLEFNPADLGNNDRNIVSTVIKETASSVQLDPNMQKSFKTIVIHEADKLSKDAQSALRRMMEKYSSNMRLILIVNDISNILDPIRSRCFAMRVPIPSKEEIKQVMYDIASKENMGKIEPRFIEEVIDKNRRNVRGCISALQILFLGEGSEKKFEQPYDESIRKIVGIIMKKKGADGLGEVRKMVYSLLLIGYSASLINNQLCAELIKDNNITEQQKGEVIHWTNFYNIRVNNGSKSIMHIEALVAKMMLILIK